MRIISLFCRPLSTSAASLGMTMQQTECLPAEFSQSSFDEAIVRATLHLKDHGWAIVENVLTRLVYIQSPSYL